MKPEHPLKPISDSYNRLEFLRQAEILHRRLNDLIISPAVTSLEATKDDYVAVDTDTAAEVAAAMNVLATTLNLHAAALNSILAKLNTT